MSSSSFSLERFCYSCVFIEPFRDFFSSGLFVSRAFHPNSLVRRCAHRSVKLSDSRVTIFNGCTEAVTRKVSPSDSMNRVAPSRLTHAADRPSPRFFNSITELAGKIRGRKDRLCGANGVTRMQLVLACTMLPPAERLYAVDPVGVDTMIPSPIMVVNMLLSMYKSIVVL